MIQKGYYNPTFTLCVVCLLLSVSVFTLLDTNTCAVSVKKPEWEEGDHWEYFCEAPQHPSSYIVRETIVGNDTIRVGNGTYEVMIGRRYFNDTNNSSLALFYYRRSDLAVVKVRISTMKNWVSTWIYNPPFSRFDFPLKVGKEWNRTENRTVLHNYSDTNYTITEKIHYKCLQKTEISTRVGAFDCYAVRERNISNEGPYNLVYFSPYAGNIVKAVTYEGGNIVSTQVLTSFSYKGRTYGQENDGIPGFEFLLLLAAVGITLVLLRKRKSTL